MKRLLLLLFLTAPFLAACGAPKIDASSRASLLASTEKLRNGLDPDRRDRFDKSVATILIDALDPVDVVKYGDRTDLMVEQQIFSKIQPRFNGLNEEGVLAAGEQAKASLKEKVAHWNRERDKLMIRQQLFAASAQALSQLTVTAADLEVIDSPLYKILPAEQVRVAITVYNHSPAAVEAVSLELGIGPEVGNQLWGQGKFEHTFTPALLPGQSRSINVGPLAVTVPDQRSDRDGSAALAASIDITSVRHAGHDQALVKSTWSQGDALQEAIYDAAAQVVQQLEVL